MDPLLLVLVVCAVFLGAFILAAAMHALGSALGCTTGDPPLVLPPTPYPSIHFKPIDTEKRINYMPHYKPVTIDRIQWKQHYANTNEGTAQFEAEVFAVSTALPVAKVVYTIAEYHPETYPERITVHISAPKPYYVHRLYSIRTEKFSTPVSAMQWLDKQLAKIEYRVNDTVIADSIALMKKQPHAIVTERLYPHTSDARPHSTAVPSDPKEPHIHIHSHGPNWRHSHGHNHIDADHWHGHAGVV